MGLHHDLWRTDQPEVWHQALQVYPDIVALQNVAGLIELDTWYRLELPSKILGREPRCVYLDDLAGVTMWKMRRGAWRPRNLALVKSNGLEDVAATSARAFAQADEPGRALSTLSSLAGVGPATASAVLAAFRPDRYPFLDEVVGGALVELGTPQFTATYYARYRQALTERAALLGVPWTPQDIGMALWSAAGGKAGQPR